MFLSRPEPAVGVKVEGVARERRNKSPVWGRFFEPSDGDVNQQVVALGNDGPKSGVEHPVGVGREARPLLGSSLPETAC
jgi:hypothetical protein